MPSIFDVVFYILVFLSVYAQVFFFVTYLENRKKILIRKEKIELLSYPAVTIVVPCWNEEKTVEGTMRSLLNLNYPKDKLKIFIIDDGSTDNTFEAVSKFADIPNVKIFRKENGGKHTALNLALKHTETDFFGGLDADSFADPESLIRIMSYFENDPQAMAITPSVIVSNFKTVVQGAQRVEYGMGVYFKKMFGFMGAINVTPGPLTIFKKKVFDELGPYRHGHSTEDMEIAYRMQKNGYKIENCNDAYVYTKAPATIKKLYKQRLRWVYGFINNTIDYRGVLFKKKYGNFALFTLPMGIVSIISVGFQFGRIIYNFGNFLYSKFIQYQVVGMDLVPKRIDIDPFFINTQFFVFLMIVMYFLVFFAVLFGRRMSEGKWKVSLDIIYFFIIYSLVAPLWLLRAVFNTLIRRKPAWR